MLKERESLAPVKIPLYSAAHEHTGELELAGLVFGHEGDVSILHEAVRMQLANRRAGTASVTRCCWAWAAARSAPRCWR